MIRKYNVKVNGENYEVEVELIDQESNNAASGIRPFVPDNISVNTGKSDISGTEPVGENDLPIRAPMPGTVLKVNVKPGDVIKKGQSLLVLESMKMENEITAPEDGTVKIVRAGEGNAVSSGDVLVYYRK